ncbi:MAG TPA: hypothetical protein VK841_26620 [Polyangiaceae bacterium]|jgi:hypothetical protein|nr:hypothetical protein [Polyangiaceae bacterium]
MAFQMGGSAAELEPRHTLGSRRRGRWAAAALFAASLASTALGAGSARADNDTERATARALAAQGFKAINEQRWADAVDLFGRAESLVHAPAHLLYLGRAYSHLGKLVAAHEAYVKLTRETLAPNAPHAAVKAQQDGTKELADLEGRIPTLDISVTPSAPGLAVKIDDAAIAPAMVGTSIPIDPGSHTVAATADGFATAQRSVQIAEASHGSVALELKALPGRPHEASQGPVVATSDKASSPVFNTAPAADTGHGPSTLRIVGYSALGLAVVAAGAGVAFVVESHDNVSKGNALCGSMGCPTADQSQINKYNDNATLFGQLAVTAFIVAGASAAGGIAAIVLSPAKSSSDTTASVWVGPGQMGLRGTF